MYSIEFLIQLHESLKIAFPGVTNISIHDNNSLRAFEGMPFEVEEDIHKVKEHLQQRLGPHGMTAHFGHDGLPSEWSSWVFAVRVHDQNGWQNFVTVYIS